MTLLASPRWAEGSALPVGPAAWMSCAWSASPPPARARVRPTHRVLDACVHGRVSDRDPVPGAAQMAGDVTGDAVGVGRPADRAFPRGPRRIVDHQAFEGVEQVRNR